jgi:hypothetical protein
MTERVARNHPLRLSPSVLGFLCGALLVGVPYVKYTMDLRSEIIATRNQLAKPDLPVRVGLRRALLASGLVLTMQNASGSDLPITATFGRPGAAPQTRELVLPANGVKQIGENDGWAFAAGDSVVLSNPNFRPWKNPSLPSR